MRIVIGQIFHETNTLANIKTTVEAFQKWEWEQGERIIELHDGVRDYLGGMIDKAKELGIELLPTFSALAYPSGIITSEAYHMMKSEMLTSIQQAGSFDAICLNLHGAGVAEGIDDLEGDILREIRQLVGKNIPIVATLDLHANLTTAMVTEVDALFGCNYYPHTDCFERGAEAMNTVARIVRGEINPVLSLKKLPLMIPPSTTYQSPAKDILNSCSDWEKQEDVIDCTFFHGFSHTDSPHSSVSILTITNQNPALGQRINEDVANTVWSRKEGFYPEFPSPEEGIQIALSIKEYPVVINETSDNPGAGTPGDGTHLLSAILEANIPNSCFGFIYDPAVADIAHKASVGSKIKVQLGGKTDNLHGSPLELVAYVKTLTDGQFVHTSPMWRGLKVSLGPSARLQVGNVDIIVCSVNAQTLDEQVFVLHGIDVTTQRIVALKSSQHFRAVFQPIAKKIITVDSPGLSTSKLTNLQYKRVNRPIYPLDSF
ncbi:M81 family metallopeptidase [Brevibacillus sp. AY1]|uniref:M81 family metallopeptidase n=1 Tax=Brevibacillus sp. AY1 TaxID=2807621 RepID=UPI002456679E|nr:M81 family metallopeptidase [Brevibacillus sp. AY1]MDH4619241.1 M81 family metallopeptidase [Brevibacillus sp. AY1]